MIASKVFDKKDKEVTTLEYEVRCQNGVFEFLMPSVSMESLAGAGLNTKVEGDFLDIKVDLTPQSLADMAAITRKRVNSKELDTDE